VSTGLRYCFQSRFSHSSSQRLVLYPPRLSHRVRVCCQNFVWILRTESYWIDGLYWEQKKKFEGIDFAHIFLMFPVSAILPYSHLAIVFTRMFVKLMYLYRRFGLVDAGQRPPEGNNGGHGVRKSTAVIPISHGISFSGLIASKPCSWT
jgi:hypothetical protein